MGAWTPWYLIDFFIQVIPFDFNLLIELRCSTLFINFNNFVINFGKYKWSLPRSRALLLLRISFSSILDAILIKCSVNLCRERFFRNQIHFWSTSRVVRGIQNFPLHILFSWNLALITHQNVWCWPLNSWLWLFNWFRFIFHEWLNSFNWLSSCIIWRMLRYRFLFEVSDRRFRRIRPCSFLSLPTTAKC